MALPDWDSGKGFFPNIWEYIKWIYNPAGATNVGDWLTKNSSLQWIYDIIEKASGKEIGSAPSIDAIYDDLIGGTGTGNASKPIQQDYGAMFEPLYDAINYQNELSQNAVDIAFERNAEQAQLNRDFQERMRDTQLISTMNQLKTMGINPAIAYSSGLGGMVASPSGATATSDSADTSAPNVAPVLNAIVNALLSLGTSTLKIIK